MSRSPLGRYLPGHFRNPVGLALRLVRTGDAHARFAMGSAALGVAMTPVDLALLPFERRRYRSAEAPELPILIVCGPPRSGTTLLFQLLVANLPVSYFSNLTSLFPRSPVTAVALFGRRLAYHPRDYRSYYGRARSLGAPNDALYLWDRWVGSDRTKVPESIAARDRDNMRRFFGAYEALGRKPLVAKNNNLNSYAHLVAEALPTAQFICLRRDPVYLAQALLIARRQIHGDERVPYGLAPNGEGGPVESVVRQVRFHQRIGEEQHQRIGGGRFRSVSYEALCEDPAGVLSGIAGQLGLHLRSRDTVPRSFPVSRSVKIEPRLFERLQAELGR